MFKAKPLDQRSCKHCGKPFERRPSSKVQFCSITCFNRSTYRGTRAKTVMTRKCAHCGKEFRRSAGQIKRRFCSNQCAKTARHGQKQLTLRVFPVGQNRVVGNGHNRKAVQAYKEAFPFCQRCGWREEPIILHVHHKDRNRKNYNPLNLESLCPTCHVLEHYRAGDAIWTKAIVV